MDNSEGDDGVPEWTSVATQRVFSASSIMAKTIQIEIHISHRHGAKLQTQCMHV